MVRLLFTAVMEERRKKKLIGCFFKEKGRNGKRSYQVDVKSRAIIAIDVHVHGALLRCETDGAVFQGECGVGRNVLSETQNYSYFVFL